MKGRKPPAVSKTRNEPFKLPPLPYEPAALEPHIDRQTMEIHHDKHHQAYVNNLNDAVQNTAYSNYELDDLLQPLHGPTTAAAVAAERAFLWHLGGGCTVPIAALAQCQGAELYMQGLVSTPDGSQLLRQEHLRVPTRLYLETDPVLPQIEVAQ